MPVERRPHDRACRDRGRSRWSLPFASVGRSVGAVDVGATAGELSPSARARVTRTVTSMPRIDVLVRRREHELVRDRSRRSPRSGTRGSSSPFFDLRLVAAGLRADVVDLQVPEARLRETRRRRSRRARARSRRVASPRAGVTSRSATLASSRTGPSAVEPGTVRPVAGPAGAVAEAVGPLRSVLILAVDVYWRVLDEDLAVRSDDAQIARDRLGGGLRSGGDGEPEHAGRTPRSRARELGDGHEATLSSRVYIGSAGGRSPGSRGLIAAPSRGPRRASVADSRRATSTPGHSGGTAPASHRTSLDHRPLSGSTLPRCVAARRGLPRNRRKPGLLRTGRGAGGSVTSDAPLPHVSRAPGSVGGVVAIRPPYRWAIRIETSK